MGKCVRCGKRGLFLKVSKEGLCLDCINIIEEEHRIIAEQKRLEEIAAKQRAEAEMAERRRQEEKRHQEKIQHYEEMVSQITLYKLSLSPTLAPIILSKNQVPITYSTITKKTPRDKLGNFVVIDTETTGLRPASCEIIDIAAIRFRDYKPVEKVSMLLSSKKPIPPEATKINGITDEMVSGCPRFQEIAESLVEFIGADNLVGHNLPFDLSFIIRYGADVTKIKRKYYDTLEIARKTIPQERIKQRWDRELGDYDYEVSDGIENYKLGTLCSWYGIINSRSHRAEGDALAAGFLLQKLAKDRE